MLNDDTARRAWPGGRVAWPGWCFGVLLAIWAACGAVGAPAKQVLLLHSFGREFEPFKSFSEVFRTRLAEQLGEPVEFHDVPLESARFESGTPEGPLVDYLTALFAARRLDLVVTIGGPAARFGQKYRPRLFPSTPLLIAALDQRHVQTVALATNDTVVAIANDPVRLIESILQVLPATTNVAVVIGNSPLEKFWLGEMRRDFQPFTNRVNFVWFNDLSFTEMQRRAAALPPRSVIFYALLAIDADGVPHEEGRALARLHAVANAPIFGLHDSQMGRGIVGGPLMAFDELSRNTAKVAVRLLRGEPAGSIRTPIQVPGMGVYDWRELKRWHISEARLPAGSVIRFRQPTAWEQYKGRIIGIATLGLFEAILIVLLLLNLVRNRRVGRALRESEERLRLATAAADLGVWVWDIYDNRIWVSANWSRMFRIPPEAAIGFETVFERVHSEDREAMEFALKRAIEQKDEYLVEYRITLPDGMQRWIATRGRLQSGVTVKQDRLVGVAMDITDRKRAIESVRRLQQQNELILTSAAEGIVGLDLKGNHTFVNPAAARMLGYTPEELLRRQGHSTWHHTEADGRPHLQEECLICAVFRDGQTRRVSDEVFWRKDGTSFPVEYTSTPIYQQGQLLGAVITFQDAAERKAAEQALRQSEERLRLVLEANSEGVWDWNIPSGKAFFSRRYSGMLGYEPEEFAQDYDAWKALVHPDDFDRVHAEHVAHIDHGKEFCVELRMRKKSGDWCWIRSRGTVVERDAEGRAIRMVGTHLDITERKQAEQELQQQRQELAHVARVSVMGELATSVAHELNQPLGAILSNAEAAELFLSQDPPALGELRAILADIRKDDERAGEVIRRMRSLLRKQELEREPVQMNLLVEDVFRLVSSDASLRQVAITAALSPHLPPVQGDRIQLQQVLLNLIMNAMEAMTKQPPEKRRLIVRTSYTGDGTVELSVADSGPGIEPGNLPRLFEPFFTTKQSGIGMGLPISRKIVEAHHGRISAESHPAGGAVFRVTLPAAEGKDSDR